ncbi:unnamed protein product, partial [Iphiclides podalirius]
MRGASGTRAVPRALIDTHPVDMSAYEPQTIARIVRWIALVAYDTQPEWSLSVDSQALLAVGREAFGPYLGAWVAHQTYAHPRRLLYPVIVFAPFALIISLRNCTAPSRNLFARPDREPVEVKTAWGRANETGQKRSGIVRIGEKEVSDCFAGDSGVEGGRGDGSGRGKGMEGGERVPLGESSRMQAGARAVRDAALDRSAILFVEWFDSILSNQESRPKPVWRQSRHNDQLVLCGPSSPRKARRGSGSGADERSSPQVAPFDGRANSRLA